MKAQLHIPTEQYGFVSLDIETATAEDAVDEYNRISQYVLSGDGLPENEFNAFIDKQLNGESNHIDQYEKLNKQQQYAVQVIKRALKRIEYKNRV